MGYRTTKSKIKVESNKASSYTDFFYKAFRNILFVSIPLVIISAIILSSIHSFATGSSIGSSGTDSLTISISSACTLSSVVNTEHNANINAGTYKDNIGKTTINTTCNDNNGYSIYANGYSNNEEGNNELINTSSPSNVIETGLNTSGDISAWAMKLNNIENDPSPTPPVIESAYDDVYGLIPSNWTKALSLPSGTTDMSQGSSFTTTYAVYANSSQYTGTYNGQVKYMLVHPSYKPAVYFMQDVASWKGFLNLEQSIQAIDKRDGKAYWVAKLKDGNIWMTQNLDLDLDPAKPLTSNDTDLTDHSLTGAYADNYNYDANTGVITWTPKGKTIDFQNTTVNGWLSVDTSPCSASKTDDSNTGHASLGNYYNWTAAIASSNSSSLTQNTLNDITKNPKNSICPKGWRLPTISNQSASDTGSTNEFARLNSIYNDGKTNTNANLVIDPLYFRMSGAVVSGNLNNSVGYYQSSTTWDATWLYRFYFSSTNVKVADDYGRRYEGYSIRCIAR